MKKGKLFGFTVTLMAAIVIMSFTAYQAAPKPWPVPDKNAKMTNPVKKDAESISTGKSLWSKHCASCHGKSGKGDGTKAAQLKTIVEDLTTTKMQAQSDGSLFYKISEGRDDMPSFKKKIPDQEELWSIVNYMRSLK